MRSMFRDDSWIILGDMKVDIPYTKHLYLGILGVY